MKEKEYNFLFFGPFLFFHYFKNNLKRVITRNRWFFFYFSAENEKLNWPNRTRTSCALSNLKPVQRCYALWSTWIVRCLALSSTLVRCDVLTASFERFHTFSSNIVRFHASLSTLVRCYPPHSTLVRCHAIVLNLTVMCESWGKHGEGENGKNRFRRLSLLKMSAWSQVTS